ncbi:gap protein [Mycobacterium noviomagense]|nr:gap protein [Mycobacterium noviomagense]
MFGLGLFTGINPIRVGLTLLVISRPRPVQNLLVYGLGGLMVSIPCLVVPLLVLHVTPRFRTVVHDVATPGTGASSVVRHIQVGLGVIVLSVAAVTVVRSLMGRRQRTQVPASVGATSTLVRDSATPPPIARLLTPAQDEPTEGGSAIRRLLGRVRNAWANGSLWVSWVIGFLFGGPGADEMLYVVALIVATGAAIGTQVSSAIAFVAGVLVVVEMALGCYLARPAKTQALVERLHDWARTHRRKIMVTMCTVGGAWLLVVGLTSA